MSERKQTQKALQRKMDTENPGEGGNTSRINICFIIEDTHDDRFYFKQQGQSWGTLVPLAVSTEPGRPLYSAHTGRQEAPHSESLTDTSSSLHRVQIFLFVGFSECSMSASQIWGDFWRFACPLERLLHVSSEQPHWRPTGSRMLGLNHVHFVIFFLDNWPWACKLQPPISYEYQCDLSEFALL